MQFLKWLFALAIGSGRDRAHKLTNQAFLMVELGKYDRAIETLKKAVECDPTYAHAHNELAFVYGKYKRDFDLAEASARRAIELDPHQPKFYNAIIGIQLDRAKQLKTRSEIRADVAERLQQINESIAANPKYPPTYLQKAAALAQRGEHESVWQGELESASKLYLDGGMSGAGLPITPDGASTIIDRCKSECQELKKYWDGLPEE